MLDDTNSHMRVHTYEFVCGRSITYDLYLRIGTPPIYQDGLASLWQIKLEETLQTAVSAPLLISFLCENKKTVLTKNPLANDVKKHVGFIFSLAGEIHTVFKRSDSRTKKGIFKVATKCDIACDKMRQNAISM